MMMILHPKTIKELGVDLRSRVVAAQPLPVALHPAIEEALRRHTWMPESAWQDVIAAWNRLRDEQERVQKVARNAIPYAATDSAATVAKEGGDMQRTPNPFPEGSPNENWRRGYEGVRHFGARDSLAAKHWKMGRDARRADDTANAAAAKPEASAATQQAGEVYQIPVATYLAPDGVTHWPAYSHEQREEYAMAARPKRLLTDADIRAIFLANGFTIKEGQADLKQYVFDAAHALVNAMLDAPISEDTGMGFPERDHTKPAEQQGMFRKFDVRRTDGSSALGGKHQGCRYWVLDLDHDQHAPAAMRAYAAEVRNTHPQLAADIDKQFPAAPVSEGDAMPDEVLDDLARAACLDGSMVVGKRSDYWRAFARNVIAADRAARTVTGGGRSMPQYLEKLISRVAEFGFEGGHVEALETHLADWDGSKEKERADLMEAALREIQKAAKGTDHAGLALSAIADLAMIALIK